MKKELLAVNQYKAQIIDAVMKNQVVVIEAPTGSGKTTQIPQILFEAGLNEWGTIGVTQPRRIAAFGVSTRIAEEMGVELGRLVGYKMRFEDRTSEQTKIKIMTDGILLEELRSDFLLSKYSIIMVDEAHERSLNIDFVLGLLKQIVKQRPDFKVVVSSATINAKLFSDFFNNAPIISIETKPYPIDIQYMPLKNQSDRDLLQITIVDIVKDLIIKKIDGDILIFLPGEDAIKECCERLNELSMEFENCLEVLPLYARLSSEEQKKVFNEFPGKRKIVVATNIAETSITIDGIIHVIDPGISKLNFYNPRTFTSFLESKPISKASCNQRAGRAGRTAPGIVYRLYSEEDYERRELFTKEEIYRTDLSEVVLRMADLGINHYSEFDFIAPPKQGAIYSAIETLIQIGALNENEKMTDIGKKMVDFPLEPRLSRILLEALLKYPNVIDYVIIVIAFLSAKTPFLYPLGEEIESRMAQKKFMVKGGDFFSWINLFFLFTKTSAKEKFCKKYYLDLRTMNEIVNIHSQITDMVLDKGYKIKSRYDYDDIICCICAGLKQYICKKDQKKRNIYYSATETDIRIHPGSFLFGQAPDWLIGGEVVNTGRTYIRSSSLLSEKVLRSNFQDVYLAVTKKSFLKKKGVSLETTKYKQTKAEEQKRIYILDKYFDVLKDKTGVYVSVPYHIIIQLKSKKEEIIDMDFGKLNARLVFKEKIILIDKLNSLLKYFDKIDLDNGLNDRYPKGQSLLYPNDWDAIYRYLKLLLKPTITKRTSLYAGFLCINSTEENMYNFYLEKDFFNAIETSLETMEKLFSSSIPAWNDKEKHVIESIHHKIINLAEEMEV